MRVHAAATLHASGPLPAIRLGPQPYGVLPVAPRRLSPHLDSAVDLNLHRYSGMLRFMWEEQLDRVPRLGRAGETQGVDDVLLELLQRTPVPWELRWREMVPPPQWTASDWLATFRTRQAPWLYDITDRLDIPPDKPARIQYLTASPDSHPLGVPLVAKGDAGTSYVGGDRGARSPGQRGAPGAQPATGLDRPARSAAGLRGRAGAGQGGVGGAGRRPHRGGSGGGRLRAQGRPHPRPRAGGGARPAAAADAVRLGPSARRARPRPVPSSRCTTRWRRACAVPSCTITSTSRRARSTALARFLAALDVLAAAPADELEWAFRGVLDLFSSRIDAWFTSFATARLAELRADRPQGVHVGCYGWVEDLRPDRGPAADSLGYIAAPSLAHAVTAALVRSGRQSHRAEDAFDLDMSSARVREALKLLEGVAAGQPLAALLGYRIERRLTDAGLADLIVGLRIAAPLRARAGDLDTPVESVAARDVVDGLRLLDMLPTQAVVPAAGAAAGERGAPDPARSRPQGGRRHVRRGQ